MKNDYEIHSIYELLGREYPQYKNSQPKAKIHKDAYKSLIGVMLSAQSQDKRTAQASRQLFALADNPWDMVKLSRETVMQAIHPAGLFQAKSKNILATSHKLIEEYNGAVPTTQKELMTLPGVGKKSSDIVMRFVYGEPTIAVDTHVFRLLWRLGWTDSLDEGKTSETVNKTTPSKHKYAAHMQLITHAKLVCKSRQPLCNECILNTYCDKRDIDVPKYRLRELSKSTS
jgi:endonuclease-3